MGNSLKLFINTFLHPIDGVGGDDKISSMEVLGFSWSLHLLYAFYSLLALYFGALGHEYLTQSDNYTHLVFNTLDLSFEKINLMWIIAGAILYPVIFWLGFRLWVFFLKFYAMTFDYSPPEGIDTEDVAEEILNTTLTANILLVIPIFGSFLSLMAKIYYLFVNLRKKFFFTKVQSLLVLITPFFILFLTATMMLFYVSFLFYLF